MSSRPALFGLVVTTLTLLVTPPASAETHHGVTLETVNNYNACPGWPTLSNSNASGQAFINTITGSSNPAGFSQQSFYQDNSVYDTDFIDPDLKPPKGAGDTYNFDQPGEAISFFQGHGLNYPGTESPSNVQLCMSEAQCTNPPSGQSVGNTGFGACVKAPNQGPWSALTTYLYYGICIYKDARQLHVCSSADQYGGSVWLNTFNGNTSYMAFGENPTDGNWRGAATNGGASLSIVHMSYGAMMFYPTEWQSIFAGMQLYGGILIAGGDTEDASGFGGAVANAYATNPYGAVEQGYVNAINSIQNGGSTSGCGGQQWGGIIGCGCHLILTYGQDVQGGESLYATFTEPWTALANDQPTQVGTNQWYFNMVCNYNPALFPWQGGDF